MGEATNNGGSRALYVSNNEGTYNAYSDNATSFSYATRPISVPAGIYTFSFDWKANGESTYDYLRAWVAPGSYHPTAGQTPAGTTSTSGYTTTTPDGWYDLNPAGGKLNQTSVWSNVSNTLTLDEGQYTVVLMWANDNTDGSQPPAAVDNFSIARQCPDVTGLYVSNVTNNSITLDWNADYSGVTYSVYEVTPTGNTLIESGITANNYIVYNLNAATEYTFGVQVNCTADLSSNIETVTGSTICPDITYLTLASLNGTTANISWDYNGDVDGYQVVVYRNNDIDTTVTVIVNGTSAEIAGMMLDNDYQVYVNAVCGSTNGNVNGPLNIHCGYCLPNPTSVDGSGITSVSFGGMTNTTHLGSTAGYADYTAMSGSVPAGTNATVEITYATGYTYGTVIWVDWNNSLSFDADEVVFVGNSDGASPTTLTANFLIPITTDTGSYRMRILGADSYFDSYISSIEAAAGANPCGSYSWGVAEDYTLVVTEVPSCMPVVDVTVANATDNSVTLRWIDNHNTGAIYSVYNGDVLVASNITDTFYTVTGLAANTDYTFGVVVNCSASDSADMVTVSARTECLLMSVLPFTEDFENQTVGGSTSSTFIQCWNRLDNGTSYRYPYIGSSSNYNHTEGGSQGLYWYSATTTGTYGDYQIVVLPGLNTNEIPVNTTMLTFWARPSSASYNPVFYVGVMTDPTDESTFQYYDTIRVVNVADWQKFKVFFDNYTGEGKYVAIRANRPSSYWYAYIDDITLDLIPACPAVEDVLVLVGPASASVSWDVVGNGYTGAQVEYKADTASTWNTINVTGVSNVAITGLQPETQYTVRITAVCGDSMSTSVTSNFVTTNFACAVLDSANLIDVTIGSGSTTNNYIPGYSYYEYSYTQQFFTANEIGTSGTITKITLTPSAVASQRTFEIFMGQSTDSSATAFITPDGLTCVYDGGQIQLTAGQPVTFELTTPFNYSDTSNLVVIFRDMTGSWVSGKWLGNVARHCRHEPRRDGPCAQGSA
jgi:hypothetical protein